MSFYIEIKNDADDKSLSPTPYIVEPKKAEPRFNGILLFLARPKSSSSLENVTPSQNHLTK